MIGTTRHRRTRAYRIACVLFTTVAISAPARADAEYDLARATQETFRAVAARMQPFLVRIETIGGAQPAEFVREDAAARDERRRQGGAEAFRDDAGSSFAVADGPTTGLIYAADGYIITSSFNFVREPLLISVALPDGRRLAADLVARDQVRKIALLKVEASDLPLPQWREHETVRVGEWAIALGLGYGGGEPAVTVGIVSALDRMRGNAVQTDAKLSPANYGGPLCDIDGRVIGICVPMAQRPGELAGVELYDAGIGFAVPKSRVDAIVTELMTGRSIYRGWLGVQVDARTHGSAEILRVADPSPLRLAGIKPGDRIVWAEGRDVHHYGDLVQAIYMIPAGQEIYLVIARDGLEFGTTVVLSRNTELGTLPDVEEPFDPAIPTLPNRLLP